MADAIDPDNPCEVAKALRKAYNDLAMGKNVARVVYKSGDTERDVTFHAPNTRQLLIAMRQAEAECAKFRGEGPTRRAIGSGQRERNPPYGINPLDPFRRW